MPHLDMFKFKYSMLREDQRVTLAQMYKWHEEGIRGAIKAAPRTGKTVMSMALMHKLKLRAAWIAPQENCCVGFVRMPRSSRISWNSNRLSDVS